GRSGPATTASWCASTRPPAPSERAQPASRPVLRPTSTRTGSRSGTSGSRDGYRFEMVGRSDAAEGEGPGQTGEGHALVHPAGQHLLPEAGDVDPLDELGLRG